MKKLLFTFAAVVLVFVAFLSFRLQQVFAAEDVYFTEGWVFVDVDGDGLFNYLYDYPLGNERVDWVNLNTNTPGWENTPNGISQINGFYLGIPFSEPLFPLLGRSYSINYAPDQHTKGYYGVNYPMVLKAGTDENDPTEVKHVNNEPFPQRVKTFYIRPLDCYAGVCGNQDFINPPSPNYVRFKGKDQGKGAGTNNIVVNFMIQRPPDAFSASAAPGCNLTNPQITVSWNGAPYVTPNGDPGGNNYYQVYRSTTGQSGTFTPAGPKVISNSANYSYTDTGVTTGQTYYYYVLAYNANGSRQSDPAPYVLTTAVKCTPTINSLEVIQGSPGPAPGFTGITHTSGSQAGEEGKNWLNPVNITLTVTQGSVPVKEYYVGFYDETKTSPVYTTLSEANFITGMKSILDTGPAGPKNGFLLAYCPKAYCPSGISPADKTISGEDNWYVWNAKTNLWINLDPNLYSIEGYRVCSISSCSPSDIPLYKAYPPLNYPPPVPPTWRVLFYKSFLSKNLFTGVYVKDELGSTDFNGDKEVTP